MGKGKGNDVRAQKEHVSMNYLLKDTAVTLYVVLNVVFHSILCSDSVHACRFQLILYRSKHYFLRNIID